MKQVLLTDFDGTITQRDFYEVALERLVPPALASVWTDYLAGRRSHFEALQIIVGAIRTDEAEVVRVLPEMGLDPGFHQATARLQAAGWQVVIVSAGCRWYIDRLLGPQAAALTIHANPGVFVPGQGLEMTLPSDAFLDPLTGVDKVAIARDALVRYDRVVFAGNGHPDLAPALLVEPQNRFACGWLAAELARRGQPFRKFDRWSEICPLLLAG